MRAWEHMGQLTVGTTVICMLLPGVAFVARADTHTAASCARADVLAAVNAASVGDTVLVPAGSATWSNGLTVSKGIHLKGAGGGGFIGHSRTSLAIGTGLKTFVTQAGLAFQPGQTVRALFIANGTRYMEGTVSNYSGTTLQLAVTQTGGSGTCASWVFALPARTTIINDAADDWNQAMLDLHEDPAGSVEISGIRFRHGTTANGEHLNLWYTAGGRPVLVHDCWFTHGGSIGRGIMVFNNRGIVYGCSFDAGLEDGVPTYHGAITIKWLGEEANRAWTTPDAMGARDTTGLNNFYIEDNYFAGCGNMDMDDNSRTVIRYNLFNNSETGSHGADTSSEGLRHFELYNNTFQFDNLGTATLNLNRWLWLRGGSGVITDNSMPNISSQQWGDKDEIQLSALSTRRVCNYAGHAYPIPHQVGQGHNGTNSVLDPLYIWNNAGSPVVGINEWPTDDVGLGLWAADYIVQGRDYYVGVAKPGYAKYTYPHPLRTADAAQYWAGIIAPDRAIDWTKAGVLGGIPSRTTVSTTLNPGATIAQINTALAACPSGQVVVLNPGAYHLGSGLIVLNKNNVTLRGAGADQTKLYFTGRGNCGGIPSVIGINGPYINGGYGSTPQNLANWTAGYAKGSNVLTFSSTAGLAVGNAVILEQLNDSADSDGVYVGAKGGVCAYTDGGGDVRPDRHQRQLVKVTAITSNQVTISPPLHMPNWRAGQNPTARWVNDTRTGCGIEDLSVDVMADSYINGGQSSIAILGAADCWVKGVRSVGADRSHLMIYQSTRVTIRDNYFYGTSETGGMTSYGIETFGASGDLLIENNIVQHNTAPFNVNDGGSDIVMAYNFTIDNLRAPDDLMSASFWIHSPGVGMLLLEGNDGLGFTHDNWYGTTHFVTFFRNHFYGDIHNNPPKTSHTSPMIFAAYSRFYNCVGNVLGRSGYYNTYEPAGAIGEDPRNIWSLGFSFAYNPGHEVTDSQTKPKLFRWGNYDTVTGTARFLASEVPSTLSQFANPVPTNQTLPASFYLSSKPGWFGNVPWPAVGPDVAGGDIAGYAGHANKIPARLCWENSPLDPAYGTRNVRIFMPSAYYYSALAIIAQPQNATVLVGQTATFTVTASGVAPLAYQWQTNTANIAGATNTSCTTPATTLADNGTGFRVIVANSLGSVTSSVAFLTVPEPCALLTLLAALLVAGAVDRRG